MTKYYLETIADRAIAAGVWTTCYIVIFGIIFYYLHKWYIWKEFRRITILIMAMDAKLNKILKKETKWVSPHDPGDEHVSD